MVPVSYKAADLKRRRKTLGEEEEEVDKQIEVGNATCFYNIITNILSSVKLLSLSWRPDCVFVSLQYVCAQAYPRLIQERDQLKVQLERMREEKHQAQVLIQKAREEKNKAMEEKERLREEKDSAQEESRRAKQDRERLESKVALLQERCDCLSCRVRYSL